MKRLTKLTAVLLVLLLLVATTAPTALAVGAKPAETVTVDFVIEDVYSTDGAFSFSNPELFSKIEYTATTNMLGDVNDGMIFFYSADGAESVIITIKATVAANAKDGDSCQIKLTYEVGDEDGNMSDSKYLTDEVVVEIEKPSTPTDPEPTDPTEPEDPTVPGGPSVEPTQPGDAIDYTELDKQIAAASKLSPEGYTAESWQALMDALEAAKKARSSQDQDVVDAAAAALAKAIAGLVKMDYSALEAAIADAKTLLSKDDLTKAFGDLFDDLLNALNMLTSNDQAAVDQATQDLRAAIAKLEQMLADWAAQNAGDAEPTEPVPTEPQGEFCNISMHHVWPILFFISLALNIVFIVLLVVYFVRRKKNQKDDTPLVNYDIGDDN